jgi:hypothetical protein
MKAWSKKTLTELEGEDWGKPTYPSFVVTNGHRLRKVPLVDFTPEDLRFMIGQQISLPTLVPMALDVLEIEPLIGEPSRGSLLMAVLGVDRQFWRDNYELWMRMDMILLEVRMVKELLEGDFVPAAKKFEDSFHA